MSEQGATNNPSVATQQSGALAEDLRQQYLNAMGIQPWYDPQLEVTQAPAVVEQQQESTAELASPEVSRDAVLKDEVAATPAANLTEVNQAIESCQMCELHITRQQAIVGEGKSDAELLIIVDAPVNDIAGSYSLFTEQNKTMLQAVLAAIELPVEQVFLTSLVKCLPPQQRAPLTSEMIICDDHLSAQINLIQPKAIMVLGEQASQQLLVSQKPLEDLRLRHHPHLGVPVFATYHPGDLFDSAEKKRKVWQDLLHIKKQLKSS